ncbi:sporulation integral membrane protein YlbJ [Clostridium polynesiense]|uniref:sporulation integral membrane protein YlbJ n=1 Tax=Clostridium polynesiense TaxID=1325933 RepID=UPI00058BACD7|nr:sporulation integral membrane protein YlbJ [Clostridium polynesiense]
MIIVSLVLIVIILALLYTKRFNIFYCIVFTMIIVYLLLYPKVSIESATSGLKLFMGSIFPTLFPFLVVCNMLICYDGINLYSKTVGPILCIPLRLSKQCSLALTISILCGYPLGAKYSTILYDEGYISSEEYVRLLNIATNTSPLFIIGSVATVMFGNTYLGYLLLVANYLSCFIMSIILSPSKSTIKISIAKNKNNVNLGFAMKQSLEDATKTCISVAGFVILFSVIIPIIKNNYLYIYFTNELSQILKLDKNLLNSLLLGMLEITNGCYLLSKAEINLVVKLSLASFLCSFSGFSILAQVHSFCYKHSCFKFFRYLYRKMLQGIISFIITFFVVSVSLSTVSAFSNGNAGNSVILIPFMVLLVLSLFIYVVDVLFDRS